MATFSEIAHGYATKVRQAVQIDRLVNTHIGMSHRFGLRQ